MYAFIFFAVIFYFPVAFIEMQWSPMDWHLWIRVSYVFMVFLMWLMYEVAKRYDKVYPNGTSSK